MNQPAGINTLSYLMTCEFAMSPISTYPVLFKTCLTFCLDLISFNPKTISCTFSSCLCATTQSPAYPDVTAGNITTVVQQRRFPDVNLPYHSYMVGVSGSSTLCSGDSSLEKFSLLSDSFARTAFSTTYDLWTYVDNFGRSRIYNSLSISYPIVCRCFVVAHLSVMSKICVISATIVEVNAVPLSIMSVVGRYTRLAITSMSTFATLISDASALG